MTWFEAVVLGLVEGLTEFLPISSTGHLIIASQLLGLPNSDELKAFTIIIQSGAIAAVIWNYRHLILIETLGGCFQKSQKARALILSLFVAFMPAVVVGLIAGDWIKSALFGIPSVIVALSLGGLVLILFERSKLSRDLGLNIHELGIEKSLKIGLFQCLAMWPGISRAMATILGARWVGLSAVRSAEYSFLLAVPTLLAAGVHDVVKYSDLIFSSREHLGPLFIGLVVSFITALVVIRGFLRFLSRYSMEVFGWYRIALAALVAWIFLR